MGESRGSVAVSKIKENEKWLEEEVWRWVASRRLVAVLEGGENEGSPYDKGWRWVAELSDDAASGLDLPFTFSSVSDLKNFFIV